MPDRFHYPRWLEELWANETRLHRLAEEVGEDGFAASPRAGAWSPAQCVEHLVVTTRVFLPLWDRAIAGAKPGKGEAEYAWWEQQLQAMMEPPYRMKAKTQDNFAPKNNHSCKEILELFSAAHELAKERAERLKDLEIQDLKIVSPFASWMKYNVAFSFDLLLAHERRHIWQAEQTAVRKRSAVAAV
jgi:hypothetical protein